MRGPYVIGCDVGSQGTNSALYAADGELVASAYEAYDLSFPYPTWAEQDPDLWVRAIERTVAGSSPTCRGARPRSRGCRSGRSWTGWSSATPPDVRFARR